MAFEARQAELREMVRNQYPGMEVGTVDEATAREAEKKAVLEAIDRWGNHRSQRLQHLADIIDDVNGYAEKAFETEATAARSDMRSIFADCLRSVKTPTMLGLKIVTGAALEEEKLHDALDAAKSVGAAMDAIFRYQKELAEKKEALEAKWKESERIASAIMRDETAVLEEISQIMKQAVDTQADRHKNRRELFRAFVKDSADAAKLVGSVLPLPPVVKDILDNGKTVTEAWEKMAGDLVARKARYEEYFTHDHESLLVMFKGTRADAQDFLEKHDYARLVLDWTSKARSAISAVRDAASTSGQKSDAGALASRLTSALEKAEKDAKSRWDEFVIPNKVRFFGAFTPELEKALVGTEQFDELYRKIASIDLQGLLQRWIGDENRDWREIDQAAMPDAWHDELREAQKQSLERLAATEEEIAKNNGSDVLVTWIKGKPAELVNRIR